MTEGNSYERQASLKASNGLVCSMINAGLIKPESIEDAFLVEESYYKRILERITEGIDTADGAKTSFSVPSAPPAEKKIRVRLKDGAAKTLDHKTRLKELHFWWNDPKGSYDWNKEMTEKEWLGLKDQSPFKDLEVEIKE